MEKVKEMLCEKGITTNKFWDTTRAYVREEDLKAMSYDAKAAKDDDTLPENATYEGMCRRYGKEYDVAAMYNRPVKQEFSKETDRAGFVDIGTLCTLFVARRGNDVTVVLCERECEGNAGKAIKRSVCCVHGPADWLIKLDYVIVMANMLRMLPDCASVYKGLANGGFDILHELCCYIIDEEVSVEDIFDYLPIPVHNIMYGWNYYMSGPIENLDVEYPVLSIAISDDCLYVEGFVDGDINYRTIRFQYNVKDEEVKLPCCEADVLCDAIQVMCTMFGVNVTEYYIKVYNQALRDMGYSRYGKRVISAEDLWDRLTADDDDDDDDEV